MLRAALFFAVAVALLLIGLWIIDRWQQDEYKEVRGTDTDEFMQSGSVVWNGEKYKKIPAVTTILIAGIDQEVSAQSSDSTNRYRNGGQADFLLLAAVDSTNRQVHMLQIDRDTMTDVMTLSVFGRETGTRLLQICLAHNYGYSKDDNAKYTVRAVQNLVNGIDINSYYMVSYSAIPMLNDALGGVQVTVPDDMTAVNPAWIAGAKVTLQGDEAETFVRARKTVGEGTNEERMRRQSEFIRQALSQLGNALNEETQTAERLLKTLRRSAATNIRDADLLTILSSAASYELLPIEYLEGEHKIGSDGFMEFHMKENSGWEWVLRHLYTK